MSVHGRSDATLNRNGVPMDSSDIYHAVETVPDVTESRVAGVERPDGSEWMALFMSLAPGAGLDDRLQSAIRTAIHEGASPRHLPDDILQIDAAPHTLTGKKLRYPSSASCSVNVGLGSRILVRSIALDLLVEIADLAAARSPS
jgi:acetoacetyl-CoA synthetase